MQFWNEMEGQVFGGHYPLRRLMRSEGRTAWFETDDGDGRRATISVTESLTDVEEVVARLEAAQRLQNPNLVAISKVGRARFERTLFVYALMEYTEQNLAEVLLEQPLSKEDVHEVAEALVGALTAVHREGLSHGRVEASSVLAIGETVKLRSDCLQTTGSSRAADVVGLGATLFHAFTQHKAERADDGQINRLPAPFSEIVRNSLNSRWSLPQVAAALRPPTATVPAVSEAAQTFRPPAASKSSSPTGLGSMAPVSKPAAPAPLRSATLGSTVAASATVASTAPAPAQPPARTSAPPAVTVPAPISSNRISPRTASWNPVSAKQNEDYPDSHGFRPALVYIALGVALLLIIAWVVFRPSPKSTAAGHAASPHVSTLNTARPPEKPDAGTPAAEPPPARTARAQPAKPSAVHSAATLGANAPATRAVWRVVAFTYNREDQALRKTEEISRDHADLKPSVLSLPGGGHSRFLVTIGGAMDRSQALALRDKATAMGLPADSYVQNFSH